MASCFSFLCCVLVLCIGVVFSGNIPDYIHICHRSDPRVAACVKSAVEALRPKLIKGIPEINVPGLDPFTVEKVVIFDGADNRDLRASLENIVIKGAGNFEITKLKLDVEKMTYRIGAKIPVLDLEGDYNINARILVTPIVGKGKFYANATNVEAHAIVQGYLENGQLKFKSIDLKLLIKDFSLHLENLFGGGNEILGRAANELLNTNKEELIQQATPFIERKCSEIFLNLSNRITDNLKYDEVFPV